VIVDGDDRPRGLVRLQDLVRRGIAV